MGKSLVVLGRVCPSTKVNKFLVPEDRVGVLFTEAG